MMHWQREANLTYIYYFTYFTTSAGRLLHAAGGEGPA